MEAKVVKRSGMEILLRRPSFINQESIIQLFYFVHHIYKNIKVRSRSPWTCENRDNLRITRPIFEIVKQSKVSCTAPYISKVYDHWIVYVQRKPAKINAQVSATDMHTLG